MRQHCALGLAVAAIAAVGISCSDASTPTGATTQPREANRGLGVITSAVTAELVICKEQSRGRVNPTEPFVFLLSTGERVTLHVGECSAPFVESAGRITVTEVGKLVNPGSYFVNDVYTVPSTALVSTTGPVGHRPATPTNVTATIDLLPVIVTKVTFDNVN